jgi:hypothetical protein
MESIHVLPPDSSILARTFFAKGQQNAITGKTIEVMLEYSDGILARHGFTLYDAYWTGVDSILEDESPRIIK